MQDISTEAYVGHSIVARIDRLPPSRHLAGLVGRIAAGGWFEFYELFMPGFILPGLTRSGIFQLKSTGLFDFHSFASFLASFFLGMLISTAVFGFVSDRFGRRAIFVWSMVIYSVAQLTIALMSDPVVIDIARFVAGLAVGIQLINNDSFISELTPRHARGRYMTLAFVFILTAVPVAAFLAAALVPHAPFGVAGWRFVVLIGALSGVVVWFAQRGLPESPRWLEVHGRIAEADQVLSRIEQRIAAECGGVLPAPEPNIPDPQPQTGAWREMFGGFYLPRTIIISIFQFCQTIAVFGFTAFIPVLLIKHGFTIVHSLVYSSMIVLLTPVGAAVGAFLAERVERKRQLVFAAILIGVMGFIFAEVREVPLILFSGGMIALGNNWMISIFHPYAAELFPTRIRARAVGFTFSWSRVSSIFVGYWTTDLLMAYGPKAVFAMIGVAMLAIIVAIGVFGPRTNGRSLETLSP